MDFVDFDLAKKLKEKGFDWETSNVYEKNTIACRYEDYPKPTISQVLKWLREEKLILIGLSPMQEYGGDEIVEWCATVYKAGKQGELSLQEEFYYQSYEQAAINGIEYALDNLI